MIFFFLKTCIIHSFFVPLQPQIIIAMKHIFFFDRKEVRTLESPLKPLTMLSLLSRKVLISVFVWMPSVVAWAATPHDQDCPYLHQLDLALDRKQDFVSQKEDNLENIRAIWRNATGQTRFDLASEIYLLYNGLNTDSAYAYALYAAEAARDLRSPELIQRALIYQAQCMSINCLFDRARVILQQIEPELYESNQLLFYKACCSLCIWESEFSTIQAEREADWRKVPEYRKRIMELEPDPVWRAQEEAILQAELSTPEQAIATLLPVFQALPPESDQVRFLANSLGSFYARLNQTDSALHYYAISAISDIHHGVMEHASLREVALILFRQGDTKRAYRYMQCCIEDAEYCKARLRTIEMAGDMPVILETYKRTIREQQEHLRVVNTLLISGIVLLLLVVMIVVFVIIKLHRANEKVTLASEQLLVANDQLRQRQTQLEDSNLSLQDSNRIRSAYVTQYMKECSDTIEKLGLYHKQLLRTALSSNYEALLAAVKSTDFIDENLRTFYLHFDETFLSLFPHFVEDFNQFLRPDAQFPIPSTGKLSTELRIFALIRLGISDSDDIARFLRLSPKTVHNYRAAVRNRATESRATLESRVLQIGL